MLIVILFFYLVQQRDTITQKDKPYSSHWCFLAYFLLILLLCCAFHVWKGFKDMMVRVIE